VRAFLPFSLSFLSNRIFDLVTDCSDTVSVIGAATGVADHTGPYFGVNMGHGSCANLQITTVLSGTKTVTTTAAVVTAPFSTSLSLRVTSTPSNIPIDNSKTNAARGTAFHAGAGAVVVGLVSALAGAVVLL
jgi:hypothetical protein